MLLVELGGVDSNIVSDGISGGWQAGFTVNPAAEATLSIRYKLTQAGTYESDEYSEVRVTLDGVMLQSGGIPYLARLAGDGNRGPDITTGWQQATLNLGMLAAGNRTLTFGGYNSKKTLSDEETEILFDNVEMVTVGSGGGGDPRTVRLHKDYLGSIRVATDGDGQAACGAATRLMTPKNWRRFEAGSPRSATLVRSNFHRWTGHAKKPREPRRSPSDLWTALPMASAHRVLCLLISPNLLTISGASQAEKT